MKIWIRKFTYTLIFFLPFFSALYGDVIATLDNPGFRKLVLAVPDFKVAKNIKSIKATNVAREGFKELNKLLEYSGYFNIISKAAYVGIDTNSSKISQESDSKLSGGLEGLAINQWKVLGIDSLIVGNLFLDNGQLKIKLRAIDIVKQKLLVGRIYSFNNIQKVIRRFADLVLKEYTGLPGIFSSSIVFIGRRTKKSAKQVFVCDFDGSNLKQITRENSPHVSPSFSPDGRYITYTSFEDRNPDIFIYDRNTGRKTKLTRTKGLNSGANWSPNGKVIAFSGSVNGNVDIYTVNIGNYKNRQYLIRGTGLDVDPTFSPDGNSIAFVSGRYGNPHIFLAKLAWKNDQTVNVLSDSRLTYAGWYNATPTWSPDSKKIAFAGYDKDIDRFDIFIMNADGKKIERLTLKSGDNESPSFSPNGQLIAFQSNRLGSQNVKAQAQIFIMNRNGTNQRKLDLGLYEAQTPTWSKNNL